jgi:hypothetical protein
MLVLETSMFSKINCSSSILAIFNQCYGCSSLEARVCWWPPVDPLGVEVVCMVIRLLRVWGVAEVKPCSRTPQHRQA